MLGTFLRMFTFGHIRQLDSVASTMLTEHVHRTLLLADADKVACVVVDGTGKATYGCAKQDAGFGCSGVKGLNALIATVNMPQSAPVICATRLRKGSTNFARNTPQLIAAALTAAKVAGAGGPDGRRVDAFAGRQCLLQQRCDCCGPPRDGGVLHYSPNKLCCHSDDGRNEQAAVCPSLSPTWSGTTTGIA